MKHLTCFLLGLVLLPRPSNAQTPFWQQTSDGQIRAGIADLASDASGVIYVGAFEIYPYPPWDKGGVYRSTDQGGSWEYVSDLGNRLSTKGDTLYVIRRSDNVNTIYYSATGGLTWNLAGTFSSGYFRKLLVTKNGLWFAATESGVYRSLDGGKTWSRLNSGISDLWINCIAEKDGIILAGTNSAGTFRSTDNGTTWSGGGTVQVFSLTVAPNGDVFSGTNFGVFRSADAGASWSATSLDTKAVYSIAATASTILAVCEDGIYRSTSLGQVWTKVSDERANRIIANSKGNFFLGNWDSPDFVMRSFDSGTTWRPTGFKGVFILSILPRQNDEIFIATYGSYVFRSTNLGTRWTQLSNGLGSPLIVSLTATKDGRLFAGTDGWGIFRSTDNGATWVGVNEGLGANKNVFGLASDDSGRVFAACNQPNPGGGGLYVSADLGGHWTKLLTSTGSLYSLYVGADGLIAAGSSQGAIHTSIDDGVSWTSNEVTGFTVRALTLGNTGTLFAGADYPGGIWKSTDRGLSWSGTNFATKVSATSLAIDKTGTIWAGTYGEGVYRSTDGGDHWERNNNGLTNVYVMSVSITETGHILVGTNQSGVFRSNQPITSIRTEQTPVPLSFRLEQNYPNPFNPATTIQFSLPKEDYVGLKIFNLLGEEVGTLLSERLQAGLHSVKWNATGVPSGVYFYRLQTGAFSETKKLILIR